MEGEIEARIAMPQQIERPLSRIALIIALISLTTLALPGQVATAQIQEGLPVELYIPDEPPLDEQLVNMRALYETGLEQIPQRGFGSGLRDMFTGGGEEIPTYLPVSNLLEQATVIRGDLIETDGIFYADLEAQGGTVRSMGREITVEMMHGVTPQGFEGVNGDAHGMPVSVIGRIETAAEDVVLRASEIRPSAIIAGVRIGRILEIQEDWEPALEVYLEVANHGALRSRPLAAFARIRVGTIAVERLGDEGTARAAFSAAYEAYGRSVNGRPRWYTWVQVPGETWEVRGVGEAIGGRLDRLNSGRLAYRIVDLFVRMSGGNPAFGVLLMALIVRLGIYPLTKKQLQSQRRMQAIQPQIKELQKEYKTDKQKFQEEFWELCKRNDCNPLGGCLPMLVQMPILIFLYRGISQYIVRFDGVSFLWVDNLADPNMILLILYTLSMVAFQKLIMSNQPAADPQQQQQQKMMIYLMPLMFFFFFQSFPAAFLLYWLGSNVIYFGEQFFYMRVADGDAPAKAEADGEQAKSSGFVATMLESAKRTHGGAEKESEPPLSYEEKRKQEKNRKRKKRR